MAEVEPWEARIEASRIEHFAFRIWDLVSAVMDPPREKHSTRERVF
jgi:hypothetical protein